MEETMTSTTTKSTTPEHDPYREPGCTCATAAWDNRGTPAEYQGHEETCALAPDLTGWLYYPERDGFGGGAYVNPKDSSFIYIRVCPGDDNDVIVRADLDSKSAPAGQ
jgi:hypothetical protein